ncbi:protein Spindly-like [Eleutherodactylus coqui]|uniref:protein Spindly-like n=1 Tax=Eleutherodactylus coqui TaxID=57060 RepID=UPI0034625394
MAHKRIRTALLFVCLLSSFKVVQPGLISYLDIGELCIASIECISRCCQKNSGLSFARCAPEAAKSNECSVVQIATLLQLKGSQTDPEQLERLQSMVAQKNSEVEKLLTKVGHLEKCKQSYENGPSKITTDALVQGDDVYYVDLLKMKLESLSKEMETIKDELSVQRMKALAESQRVLELERKLFTTDRHLKLSQGENMKLRVSLDELRMKYEPDEIVKLQTQRRRREQLPLDCPAEAVANGKDVAVRVGDPDPNSQREGKDNVAFLSEATACSPEEKPAPSAELDVPNAPMSQDEPSSSQPVKERKRVRIAEDVTDPQTLSKKDCGVTSPPPRSSAEDSSNEPTKAEEEKDLPKYERKSRHRAQPVLHVSSKPTSVTQCPQQ